MNSPLVLMIGILDVESSCRQNIERPAVDVPDTIQFCLGGAFTWRLKTFAIDHDVHVFKLKARPDSPPIDVSFVESHIKRGYGDILKRLVTLRIADPTDHASLQAQLRAEDLEGDLELTELGYVFYKPDGARYWTQSKPEDIP